MLYSVLYYNILHYIRNLMETITMEMIHAIADELLKEGKRPTLANVREALGDKGSFTTISKGMQTWKEKQSKIIAASITPIPDDVKNELNLAAQHLWNSAMQIAEGKLHSERDALSAAREEMEATQAEAIQAADQLDSKITELNQKISGLQSDKTSLADENKALQITITRLEKELHTAHDKISNLELSEKSASDKMIQSVEAAAKLQGKVETLQELLEKKK